MEEQAKPAMAFSAEDLAGMPYRGLQKLAKQQGLKVRGGAPSLRLALPLLPLPLPFDCHPSQA
jgi:hypothetical protein